MKKLSIVVLAAALVAGCICLASLSVAKAQNVITSLTLNGASPETVITFKAIDSNKKVEVLVQDTPGTLATTDDLARGIATAIAAIPKPSPAPVPSPSPAPSATCNVCDVAGEVVLDASGNGLVTFPQPFDKKPVCQVQSARSPLVNAPQKVVTAAALTLSGGLPGSTVEYVCVPRNN